MTDTDRLAALLHEAVCDDGDHGYHPFCKTLAARLIAAGVTLAATPAPLDVERLARALHAVHGGGPCFTRYRNCETNAAAIAAAYAAEETK